MQGLAAIMCRGLAACALGWLVGCGHAATGSSSRAAPSPGTHGEGGVQLSLAGDGGGWSRVQVSIESATQCSVVAASVDAAAGTTGDSLVDAAPSPAADSAADAAPSPAAGSAAALVWTLPYSAGTALALPIVPTGAHCFAVAALDPAGAVAAVGRARADVQPGGLSEATVALVPLH